MLVAFSGFKRAGKDEAAKVLIDEYGFKRVALADAVKKLALAIDPIIEQRRDHTLRLSDYIAAVGAEKAKEHPEVRRLYQRIGTEGGRNLFGEDFWVDLLDKNVNDLWDSSTRYVLTDARFLNEGQWVLGRGRYHGRTDLFESGRGVLAWIDRPGLKSDGHASESGELYDMADFIIRNETTIEELHEDVRFMMAIKGIEKN